MHSRSRKAIPSRLAIGILLGLLLFGCEPRERPTTPVARVDDEVLTLEEIYARFDSARGISEAQVYAYIQRWIVNELLYREAVRRGFDRSEDLALRLQDIRRQLTITEMLETGIYQDNDVTSSSNDIAQYFEAHREEFALAQDVALLSYVVFSDRSAANALRTMVVRRTPWNEAVQQIVSDPQRGMTIISVVDSIFHTQATLIPANLWRAVVGTPVGTPSFPIRTDDGYFVLMTWKLGRKGETADLLYIEPEIRGRLAIERRQQRMEELVENLREQHAVEILIGPVTGDTLGRMN
jgi:hypothetical protein